MSLPAALNQVIEQKVLEISRVELSRAASELSERYRHHSISRARLMSHEADRLAYLAVRMPATYAAARAVLAEVRRLAPEVEIESLLDLGAGTGAADWAAVECFDRLRRLTLIERETKLIDLGRQLVQAAGCVALQSAEWRALDLTTIETLVAHDLVVCSYSLGELERPAIRKLLPAIWEAARCLLVIIEPGTMRGFELIRSARERLIELGGNILAPCPHAKLCPMTKDDWCHFSQRLDRSSLHRRLKGAELGYEDEKYSYLAVSRFPAPSSPSRIMRHPLHQPGLIQLELCTREKLATQKVTRQDKELWKRARKAAWGDEWK